MSTNTAPRASRPNLPGYGIVGETEGKGLLPFSWAAERLAKARNYFLSTVRPDGSPHVMVIWGVWLDDRFYFSTGKGSRKARNLAVNPRCVVVPEDGREAIIVEGQASELKDRGELDRFNREYQRKYDWDVSSMSEPVFVVKPSVAYGQIEETFTQSATRWQFGD
jgi:pyridoxine/pyridoxamine 5'-phosphate oxidase